MAAVVFATVTSTNVNGLIHFIYVGTDIEVELFNIKNELMSRATVTD